MKWEENVRRVVPYTPGEQPKKSGVIKLNTNENPYPPAPGVGKALAALDVEKFRLYPEFPEQLSDRDGSDFYRCRLGRCAFYRFYDLFSVGQTGFFPGYHLFFL